MTARCATTLSLRDEEHCFDRLGVNRQDDHFELLAVVAHISNLAAIGRPGRFQVVAVHTPQTELYQPTEAVRGMANGIDDRLQALGLRYCPGARESQSLSTASLKENSESLFHSPSGPHQ